MAKGTKAQAQILKDKNIEEILITLPKPKSEKSPYFKLEEQFDVNLNFFPFIRVEGLPVRDFRKQQLTLSDYSAVILVSRNAVDHFFRICDEMKYKVPKELKYFCGSEAVALYLQKFVEYRKRKVFFSADGSSDGLVEILRKYKKRIKIIFPVSEHTHNDVSPLLKEEDFDYDEAVLYRTVSNDISEALETDFDMILFFSPFSVEALLKNEPDFLKRGTLIGAFGHPTSLAVEKAGLSLSIKAPSPDKPSMVAALRQFLEEYNKD